MIVRKGIPSSDDFREPEAGGFHSNSTASPATAPAPGSALADKCFEAMVRHDTRQKAARTDRHFGATLIRQAKIVARSSMAAGEAKAIPVPGLDLDDNDALWGAGAIATFLLGRDDNAARKKIYYRYAQWKATRQGMPFVQFDNSNTVCMSKRLYWAWLAAELKKSNLINE